MPQCLLKGAGANDGPLKEKEFACILEKWRLETLIRNEEQGFWEPEGKQ